MQFLFIYKYPSYRLCIQSHVQSHGFYTSKVWQRILYKLLRNKNNCLGAVYMGGGTGCLPGRDVCRDGTFAETEHLPGQDVCRDGTFAGTGRFLSRVYPVSTWDDFTQENLQSQHFSFRQNGTECLYDKNYPALAGIPLCRTGRKMSWLNSFHINGTEHIRDIYMHGEIPFNVPSWQTSRPPPT